MTTSAAGGTNSPASFTNKNRVTGLAAGKAGFNTQGIVDSLMAIERRPYDDLDIKRQTEQLRLQAYQAVNTLLLNFRTSVGTLSSRTLWNSKTTTSTNEKSLTATANEYAVKGAYSFKVAQVAAATEYASKAVADAKAAISPPKKVPDPKDPNKTIDGPAEKLGTIELSSAETRVDNSAKLEHLNGGSGIFRGSIRVTDSANGTSNIDLSGAVTLEDVVRSINGASGVRVNASIRDGNLFIEDEAGGASTLKIQNVGTGTTATDLGIAGTSKPLMEDDGVTPLLDDSGNPRKAITGRPVYTLGPDMSLDLLNDGLGVEEGDIGLRVYGKDADGNDSFYELIVNLDGVKTVGDVMNRVNAEIEDMRKNGKIEPPGYGDPKELLKNLRFGVSSDGRSFGFTGVEEDRSYQFLDLNNAMLVGQATPAAQLGLTNGVQSAGAGQREVSFGRVLGDANSPMLKNLGGTADMGVGNYPPESRVPVAFNKDTKVSALNGGRGLDTSTGFNFMLTEGGTDADGIAISEADIISDAVNMVDLRQWLKDNPDATLEQLVDRLNGEIEAYAADPDNGAAGLNGLHISIDEQMERLIIDGVQPGYSLQIAGGVAQSLGLARAKGKNEDSTIQIDPEQSEREADLREAVDNFYGMGDNKKPLSTEVNEIFLEDDPEAKPPKEKTTLGDLDELLKGGSIQDLFGSGEGFTIRVGDGMDANGTPDDPGDDTIAHDYDDGPGVTPGGAMEIAVNWSDLADEDGNPLVIGEDTDVASFIDAMNRAIKDKFATTDQNPPTNYIYGGNVPQVKLNALANGLQWSNMDFSDKYWEMEGVGAGGALEAMNLERGVADTRAITEGYQLASGSAYKLNPMETGYVEKLEVSAGTADTVTVGQINYGVGITLGGEETDTFDIEFQADSDPTDDVYDGKKVSFTMKELRDAVTAKLTALADPAKQNVDDLTLNEYMGVLNSLVDKKIDEYYDTNEPGVGADDRFSMEFKVADGMFTVSDIENAEGLKITGTAVDYPYGTRTGITAISYTKDKLDDLIEAGTEIPANLVEAGTLYPQNVDGLGEIFFTLDGKDGYSDIFKLNTAGLSQDSTLNDLVNHLNDQLAKMAADGTDPRDNELLKDVRFTLNDAGTGIAVDNGSNARLTFIDSFQLKEEYEADGVTLKPEDERKRISDAQRLAQDLGLVGPKGSEDSSKTVEAYSFHNAKSLGRNYISRATSLEEFVGKGALETGQVRLTNAGGNSITVDLNGTKTLGDVIDKINSYQFGVVAQINAAGDGIDLIEAYPEGQVPPFEARQGAIGIADVEGGIGIAKKLGIAGTGTRDASTQFNSVFRGSLSTTIDVMSTDSLEDIMYRISEAGYKTSIVNDGTGSSLVVTAGKTGEKYDFVIESDVPQFGFNQVKRGKDAKVLYGDPDSSGSPRMLSSETNSNSNAILGLTLNIQSASAEWTTITVDDDKEAVTEAVKAMVTSYNELSEIIKALDAYDPESGEEGILFGDTAVRGMMDDINEFFYDVYNPDNVALGSLDGDGKQRTWTWMDLGISLNAAPSNADGTGGWYNLIDLDEEALENMVATNWDVMSKMLSNEVNVANTNGSDTMKPTGSFNGTLAAGFSADGAINGDMSKTNFGKTNGIMGADTIENGDNAYTVWFQKSTRVNRMTVNFPTAADALKDFTIEYLDSATGEWKELRKAEGNTTDMVPYGFMSENIQADAIRLTASSTNASDGKFRLSNIEIFEETGLAGHMNQHTKELGDTQFGFLASMNDEIQLSLKDIEDQMLRLEETLTAKEEALWRRFTAMETAMSKLQGQGDYFKNMMNSLGGGK